MPQVPITAKASQYSRRNSRGNAAGTVPTRHLRRRCISTQAAFLVAYRETESVMAAAAIAEIRPARHAEWLEKDPRYWNAFSETQQEVADRLQDQAVERAIGGWLEPVYYRGRQCGTIPRYADRLLMILLRAGKPEQFA